MASCLIVASSKVRLQRSGSLPGPDDDGDAAHTLCRFSCLEGSSRTRPLALGRTRRRASPNSWATFTIARVRASVYRPHVRSWQPFYVSDCSGRVSPRDSSNRRRCHPTPGHTKWPWFDRALADDYMAMSFDA